MPLEHASVSKCVALFPLRPRFLRVFRYVGGFHQILEDNHTCDGEAQKDRGECRMDILDTEMGYLGYDGTESYGITWKVRPYNADLAAVSVDVCRPDLVLYIESRCTPTPRPVNIGVGIIPKSYPLRSRILSMIFTSVMAKAPSMQSNDSLFVKIRKLKYEPSRGFICTSS